MGQKSLYHFLRSAYYEWRDHRTLCAALDCFLAGGYNKPLHPITDYLNTKLRSAADGKFDCISFTTTPEISITYTKAGSIIDTLTPPISVFCRLMECFAYLAERSGTMKTHEEKYIVTSNARFTIMLSGLDTPLEITTEKKEASQQYYKNYAEEHKETSKQIRKIMVENFNAPLETIRDKMEMLSSGDSDFPEITTEFIVRIKMAEERADT